MTVKDEQPDLTFEEAVSRLEEIVARMESGGLSLDDSLRSFEQAVSLSRYCAGRLEEAEARITVLSATGGETAANEPWLRDEERSGVRPSSSS